MTNLGLGITKSSHITCYTVVWLYEIQEKRFYHNIIRQVQEVQVFSEEQAMTFISVTKEICLV